MIVCVSDTSKRTKGKGDAQGDVQQTVKEKPQVKNERAVDDDEVYKYNGWRMQRRRRNKCKRSRMCAMMESNRMGTKMRMRVRMINDESPDADDDEGEKSARDDVRGICTSTEARRTLFVCQPSLASSVVS